MRFRKLRITWSVFWGLAAVLLIVLWVWGYWWSDTIDIPVSNNRTAIAATFPGGIGIRYYDNSDMRPVTPWKTITRQSQADWKVHSKIGLFYEYNPRRITIECAYWLLLIGAAMVTAAPWGQYRFSLRTLLIATTLVAVVMGLIVWAAK